MMKNVMKVDTRRSVMQFIMNFTVAIVCMISAFISYEMHDRDYCFLSLTLSLCNLFFAVLHASDIAAGCRQPKSENPYNNKE